MARAARRRLDSRNGKRRWRSGWAAALPDFGSTPRQVLNSGDHGTLALLDRFVNAIATFKGASHPRVVRDIVRQRIETMFENRGTPIPFTGT